MPTDVKVPAAGESISEVFIGTWLKNKGDAVAQDEALVEVETDKATLEVPSPVAGVLTELLKDVGDAAAIGEVIARIDESGAAAGASPAGEAGPAAGAKAEAGPAAGAPAGADSVSAAAADTATSTSGAPAEAAVAPVEPPAAGTAGTSPTSVLPAAQRLLDEHGLNANEVPATGPGGRLLKEDVQAYLAQREREAASDIGDSAADAAATTYGVGILANTIVSVAQLLVISFHDETIGRLIFRNETGQIFSL